MSSLGEAWYEWLAALIDTHGRLGDGDLLITHPRPDVVAKAMAGLRALGIDYALADGGIRLAGEENLQRLLRELPLGRPRPAPAPASSLAAASSQTAGRTDPRGA